MNRFLPVVVIFIFAFAAASCQSAPIQSSSTNFIHNPGVNSPVVDYIILGRVSGQGSIVYNAVTQKYSGDTMKYGSLGMLREAAPQNSNPLNVRNIPMPRRSSSQDARELAISNATYVLIERANMLSADAVIYVTTAVDIVVDPANGTVTTNATVSGIAVRVRIPN